MHTEKDAIRRQKGFYCLLNFQSCMLCEEDVEQKQSGWKEGKERWECEKRVGRRDAMNINQGFENISFLTGGAEIMAAVSLWYISEWIWEGNGTQGRYKCFHRTDSHNEAIEKDTERDIDNMQYLFPCHVRIYLIWSPIVHLWGARCSPSAMEKSLPK